MSVNFNPSRLDLGRRRRGLTRGVLAERIGVSTRVLNAYDHQEYVPGPETLRRLAATLDFPVSFFYGPDLDEPPLEGSSFRALSNLTARSREQALAAGALAMLLADWIDARFVLPEPNVPTFQGVDPETAAMSVRTEWGLGERPIQNMVHVLEAHGVRVFSLVHECAAVDAFSFWRGHLPHVCLDTMKSPERSRMDAAHELGHLVLHWKGGVRGRESELEAQQFGAAFLMPRSSVVAEAPRSTRLDELIHVKRRWNVSLANLVYRMRALGLLTEWQYRSLFIEMSGKGYRTHEPNPAPSETSQVFDKVFRVLREDGVGPMQVAEELNLPPGELGTLVFGLALTPLKGLGEGTPKIDKGQTALHLV